MALTSASPGPAEAVLHIYEDAAYSSPKSLDSLGRYPVLPGETIYIHLDNLNDEKAGIGWSTVEIRVGTPEGALPVPPLGPFDKKTGDPFHAGADPYVGDGDQNIVWVVGDADGDGDVDYVWQESTTLVIQYKYDTWPSQFVASGPITTTGHLHVVPETALGVAGTLVIAIAALAVFGARRRR